MKFRSGKNQIIRRFDGQGHRRRLILESLEVRSMLHGGPLDDASLHVGVPSASQGIGLQSQGRPNSASENLGMFDAGHSQDAFWGNWNGKSRDSLETRGTVRPKVKITEPPESQDFVSDPRADGPEGSDPMKHGNAPNTKPRFPSLPPEGEDRAAPSPSTPNFGGDGRDGFGQLPGFNNTIQPRIGGSISTAPLPSSNSNNAVDTNRGNLHEDVLLTGSRPSLDSFATAQHHGQQSQLGLGSAVPGNDSIISGTQPSSNGLISGSAGIGSHVTDPLISTAASGLLKNLSTTDSFLNGSSKHLNATEGRQESRILASEDAPDQAPRIALASISESSSKPDADSNSSDAAALTSDTRGNKSFNPKSRRNQTLLLDSHRGGESDVLWHTFNSEVRPNAVTRLALSERTLDHRFAGKEEAVDAVFAGQELVVEHGYGANGMLHRLELRSEPQSWNAAADDVAVQSGELRATQSLIQLDGSQVDVSAEFAPSTISQTYLPLSFVAIGGLLLASRKRFERRLVGNEQ